jgi:hypothetical protein
VIFSYLVDMGLASSATKRGRQKNIADTSSSFEICNGLGLAQTYSSTSWDSSCTVIYTVYVAQPTSGSQFSAVPPLSNPLVAPLQDRLGLEVIEKKSIA